MGFVAEDSRCYLHSFVLRVLPLRLSSTDIIFYSRDS